MKLDNCQNDIKSLKINNTITNNPQKIANTFNDYFLNVTDTVIRDIKKITMILRITQTILVTWLKNLAGHVQELIGTMQQLIKLIRLSNPWRLKLIWVWWNPHRKILKLSAPFIIFPLTYICNKSLLSCVFPNRTKYAIIKPLYKKGDKLLTTNYRPISLLISMSKISEKTNILKII